MPDQSLTERNAAFAVAFDYADLEIKPHLSTLIVGCVDSRVDPAHLLGLEPGDAVVMRNVGGRVTDEVIEHIKILEVLGSTMMGVTIDVALIHHTGCGASLFAMPQVSDALIDALHVESSVIESLTIVDPVDSIHTDIERLPHDGQAVGPAPLETGFQGVVVFANFDAPRGDIDIAEADHQVLAHAGLDIARPAARLRRRQALAKPVLAGQLLPFAAVPAHRAAHLRAVRDADQGGNDLDIAPILALPAFRDVTGILHCWSGDLPQAQRSIDLGFLIGVGGPITYKKSTLPEIAAALPWEALVVETDAPYLAPVPRRGLAPDGAGLCPPCARGTPPRSAVR